MTGFEVELAQDEEILFESEEAVLTSQRLVTQRTRGRQGPAVEEVYLKDIAGVRKFSGGHNSYLRQGAMLAAAGFAVALFQSFLVSSLHPLLDMILFLVSSAAILVGLYLVARSITRVRPHTTVLFQVPGEGDFLVNFPDKDNPRADQLLQRYQRHRRGF